MKTADRQLAGSATFPGAPPQIRAFRFGRGSAYCLNKECETFIKPFFLLNHRGGYWCNKCKEKGIAVIEGFEVKNNNPVYKEVRVEFNYDPINKRFRSLAIVRDEEIADDGNVFTLYSPMYNTEKRAIKAAEALLGNLLLSRDPTAVKFLYEEILSLDDTTEMFTAKLDMLSKKWQSIETMLKESRK